MKIAKARTDEEKKEIYGKWEKLINMSEKQLLDWAEDDDRFLASLNRARAEEEGDIQSGYDSFHRIKRRKIKPMKDWSAQDFDNASQENGFNSRMLGGKPGQPVKDTGMSKWEISLKNWGHDPSKKSSPSYDKWKAWDNKHNKKAFFNRFLIQKAFHKKNGNQTMRTASRILWYNVNFKDPHTGHIEVYAEELSKRDAESDVRDIKSHGGDAWVVPVTSQDQYNKANSALGYRNATTLKTMRRTSSSVLRDLEIRIATLEKDAFFNFDFGVDKIKSQISDLMDKIPFFREIQALFKKIFRVRSFKDAKKEAKKLLDFGERNSQAQEYLSFIMREERSLKGRISLVVEHLKNPSSRPSFDSRARDGARVASLLWLSIYTYVICKIIQAVAVKLGIGALLLKIGVAALIVFFIAVIIFIFVVGNDTTKKDHEEIRRRNMNKRASERIRIASLVEHCIYEELDLSV